MSTWSDKQLSRHKSAQKYISYGGATLGLGALGAAALGSKAGGRTLRKVGQAALKGGASVGTANRIAGASGRAKSASSGLTVGSAGVGGIGGYNFGAIQGQEAKRSKMKKSLSSDVEASPFAKKWVTTEQAKPMHKWSKKDQAQETGNVVAGTAGALGLVQGASTLTGGRAAVKAGRKRGVVASPTQLKNIRRVGRTGAALTVGGAALTGGAIANEQRLMRRNVKKSLSPEVAASPFAKAFDPERSRHKRSEAYQAGSNIAAGALGAAGGQKLVQAGKKVSALKGKTSVPVAGLKSIGTQGGKGLALVAAGGGAAYGAKKIGDHRKSKGRSYRPLPLS